MPGKNVVMFIQFFFFLFTFIINKAHMKRTIFPSTAENCGFLKQIQHTDLCRKTRKNTRILFNYPSATVH